MSKKRRSKKKSKAWLIPIVVITLFSLLTIGVYAYVSHLYSLSNYIPDSAVAAGNNASVQAGTTEAVAVTAEQTDKTDNGMLTASDVPGSTTGADGNASMANGTVNGNAAGNAGDAALNRASDPSANTTGSAPSPTEAPSAAAVSTPATEVGAAIAEVKEALEAPEVLDDVESFVDSTGLTTSAEEMLKEQASAIKDVAAPQSEDVYNLLLVGVDRRDTSWNGNSDAMILMSINHSTKKVKMISFMRDLYAEIEGHGIKKLNAACAYGGCPLLVKTIENNYKVKIDNYASVDYEGMVKVIDALGGVDIEISDREVEIANGYIYDMCNTVNKDYTQHIFTHSGQVHASGYQAVGYARIRYVGNSDYERTERQRKVISSLISAAKTQGLMELNSMANAVLPYVTHNIEMGTLAGLLFQIPDIMTYEMSQSRIPYDGLYTVKGEILMPDMATTISELHEEIYGG